ncbi:Hint domain-containing protein [Shimia aestuarii]|uniref:YD repeat-containing protein n=1 Tax=Shimia aestuarii TaxID=254406 RepID=A0A1I4JGY6_9RHOB|nr:Hint domain-containing protein [Shimia aestuarii]SFL65453.1 YD repeat-containing protein [Shimia aestuarii]
MADPTGPGVVDGTENDDILDVGTTDSDGDSITVGGDVVSAGDGDDSVRGGEGDDTLFGGMGSDTVRGGADDDIILGDEFGPYDGTDSPGDDLLVGEGGNDTIFGGDGNDTIYGDYEPGTRPAPAGPSRESFNWDEVGTPSDEDPLGGPYTQDTGSVEVTFTTGTNHGVETTFEDDPQILTGIDSGTEPTNPNSALASEVEEREGASYMLSFSEPVEDVQFRINDIDNDSAVKVYAYDAEGNRIEVNLTGSDTTNLNILDIDGAPGKEAAVSGGGDGASDDADNSVLVDIPGPVHSIEIVHLNLGTEPSEITMSDVYFTNPANVVAEDADDLLIGGAGDDVIYGQEGNDTIAGVSGQDDMYGGDDRDVFALFGPGSTIHGGEGGDDFDSISLAGLVDRYVPGGEVRVEFDPLDSEAGTITYIDDEGNVVGVTEFFEIENIFQTPVILCFTPGTRILTPMGEIPVEQLQPGDKVVTRDNGLQEIRWAGKKHLSGQELMARPQLRPVLIKQGALGPNQPERDMMVSPNHRMLLVSQQAELLFDEREVLIAAKHLTHLDGVQQVDTVGVDYVHFMCDNHEVVLADGAWSESFQPGEYSINGIDKDQRAELYDLFPELRQPEGLEAYPAARLTLKRHEAQLIG